MDSTIKGDAPLLKYKFVIGLNSIQLNSKKSIQCTIKYSYGLTHRFYHSTEMFTILPDSDDHQKIADHEICEFIIAPSTKESEIKDYLSNNEFKIRIYDEDMVIGTARFNLMKIYEEESIKVG